MHRLAVLILALLFTLIPTGVAYGAWDTGMLGSEEAASKPRSDAAMVAAEQLGDGNHCWKAAGYSAATATVAVGGGMASVSRIARTPNGVRVTGSTRAYQLERHGPHHRFNGRPLPHIQLNVWKPGVKGSGWTAPRIPLGRGW